MLSLAAMTILIISISIFCSYLLGSVCSAILVCLAFKLPDPRKYGSFNPGATNVLRLSGRIPAIITLLGDGLKGYIATFLGMQLDGRPSIIMLFALAAFFGHLYPIFFRFRGGKGFATAAGVWLALDIKFGGLLLFSWAIIFKLFRRSSLAALFSAALAPWLAYYWFNNFYDYFGILVISCYLYWRHIDNIKRLLNKQEAKINN